MQRLTKRHQFQRVTRDSRRFVSPSFVVQVLGYEDPEVGRSDGITASRRVGNAVARNRAKRRMRPLLALLGGMIAKPSFDVVMIARQAILRQPFHMLLDEVNVIASQINKRLK